MTSRLVIALAIAAGLAVPLEFRGQGPIGPIDPRQKSQPGQAQPEQKIDESRVNLRIESTLVLVPVEVSDELNRPVSGLDKENFKVFDDKVQQKITSFAMEDEPIAICLVIDVSGSMGGNWRDTTEAGFILRDRQPRRPDSAW